MDKPCACPPKCARTARLSRPFRGAVTAIRENGAASGAGVLAEFEYDNLGRRIALHRADNAGVSTVYAYDAASRLSSLQQDLSGTANDPNFSFTYNAAGQAVSRTSNAAYDWPQPSISAASYTPNGRNQYTTVGGGAFTYDARGNLTATGAATYGYDAFNRLTSAGSATLSYDPAGRLHQTTSNGSTVTARFLYDGVDAIAEYDSSNVMQRRYVHGPGMDEPLVEYVGSGTSDRRWLVTDQLGSVVAATNASGAQIGSANTYDEYGVPAATNSGRFQYTGQMWIGEAALYHYKARAYLPSIGRFAQSDPILYAGGMNLYTCSRNDPVNFVDPLGLEEEELPELVISGYKPISIWETFEGHSASQLLARSDLLNVRRINRPHPRAKRSAKEEELHGPIPTPCISMSDGPVNFYGGTFDFVLGAGLGIAVYRFDIPSTGASGVVTSGSGYLGLGASLGVTGGQIDTMGNFLGEGWRVDFELPGAPGVGISLPMSSSGRLSGLAGTVAAGGGVYGGKTQTRLVESSVPLCPD